MPVQIAKPAPQFSLEALKGQDFINIRWMTTKANGLCAANWQAGDELLKA